MLRSGLLGMNDRTQRVGHTHKLEKCFDSGAQQPPLRNSSMHAPAEAARREAPASDHNRSEER